MTGFGRAVTASAGFMVTVEAKSVNHKSLSVSLKLPDVFSSMEPLIRKTIEGMFNRGRVRFDTVIDMETADGSGVTICVETAEQYINASEILRVKHDCLSSLSAGELLRLPGVVLRSEPSLLDSVELSKVFEASMTGALAELKESRCREGSALEPFFRSGLLSIRELAVPVLSRQKETVQEKYTRLRERISELIDDVRLDEDRLMNELALMADRSDVTEEIQRLECHLDHALEIVDSHNIPVGRKLEFIIQEIHRELNTMGAKVDDPEQSLRVIEMKNILSSLKEQAANIE